MAESKRAERRKRLVIVAAVGREPSRRASVRQAVREALEGTAFEPELRLPVGRPQLIEALPGAQVLFSFRLDEEMLLAGKSVRWAHLGVSGVDQHLPPAVHRDDLVLTNCRGIHGRPMAEYVLGVILGHAKGLFRARDMQWDHVWEPRDLVPQIRPVQGTTLGIVGLGASGRELAVLANALGMRVLGLKRSLEPDAKPPPGVDSMLGPAALDQLLMESDWTVLLLPLTPETRGLISRARIGKMKKGAFLINAGRGELLDEKALLHALERGRLSGAALDVFREEPLPQTSELWDTPQILVTPHIAGNFPGYVEAAAAQFGENLARYVRDEPLLNKVDVKLGY